MIAALFKDKVSDIFFAFDDFCLLFEQPMEQLLPQEPGDVQRRKCKASRCDSEIISLLIAFHSGGFRNFKFFYTQYA